MKEYSITVGGNKFRLSQPDARQVDELYKWAKKVMPDPVAEVLETARMLEGDVKQQFLKEQLNAAFERKKKRGALTDPETTDFLHHTVEGKSKLIAALFKKHHPNLTDDEALNVALQATLEHGEMELLNLHDDSTRLPMREEEAEAAFFRAEGTSTR